MNCASQASFNGSQAGSGSASHPYLELAILFLWTFNGSAVDVEIVDNSSAVNYRTLLDQAVRGQAIKSLGTITNPHNQDTSPEDMDLSRVLRGGYGRILLADSAPYACHCGTTGSMQLG